LDDGNGSRKMRISRIHRILLFDRASRMRRWMYLSRATKVSLAVMVTRKK
jgi:hypothetical protein